MKSIFQLMAVALALGNVTDYRNYDADFRANRRGKHKGGCGGSGTLLKRRMIRKPPAGYWQQVTPIEHMHSAARIRLLTQQAV